MANMWMVRAGENAFLIDDFKEFNCVVIGWEIGDLTGKTPSEIKSLMERRYPESSKTSLALNSAQVIKFVCDFEIGDWVISYNPDTRNYLVGRITSDYYLSNRLAEKYNENHEFYHHFRDVEWIGETSRDDLSESALKPLKSVMTIFNLNNVTKNDILYKMNNDKIGWTDFYMEFADKLLTFKNNRSDLIRKISNVFDELNMTLPTLERDLEGHDVLPEDIDPFTVFALFNKQISYETRLNIITQIKKEFSLKNDVPISFHGVATVNNLKATFYWFMDRRGEVDIENLWKLFEIALNENLQEFSSVYDKVITQDGIRWNITMGLNWIRPFTFINLDANSRNLLSSSELFSNELKDKIKSLKTPPEGDEYLKICEEVKDSLRNSEYNSLPEFSHKAYLFKQNNGYDSTGDGIGDGDVQTVRYWLISPGSGAVWWDDFYKNGDMGIGFEGTGDLKQYKSKEEIREKFQEIYKDNSSHRNDVHACWQFVHEVQIGDVVFVKNGMSEIIGRGIVEGDYEYDTTKAYHKLRKVNWTHKGHWDYERGKLPMKTITDITVYHEMVNSINDLFILDKEVSEPANPIYPDYPVEKFLEEVYIGENDYIILENLLKNKKNLIVEGAPGVGKTFMAKRLAYSIMGVKDIERVMMVQFHQSYSYEDFVMGYRPSKEGFELRNGSFYNFCKKAEEDSENDYFFIIDEINRGNLSKIFGELFMLIEADKRGEKNKIQLLYSDELFFIPKNVYIIGLMNTADRSLAMIDYALRRRFAFFDLKPGFESEGFKSYQSELDSEKFNKLTEIMKELNLEIKDDESLGEGFRIGHSYLCNISEDEVNEKLEYIVEYELIPLLKEYWFDESEKVNEWSDRLRSVL